MRRSSAKIRITTKDLEVLPDPQSCIDKMVEDFVSGHPFDEKARAVYLQSIARVPASDLKTNLEETYQLIINAFTHREGLKAGTITELELKPYRDSMLSLYEQSQARKPRGPPRIF